MPSLKMGKNSASGCLKEKCGLQVCQKSILISKNVPCNARVYHMVDDIFNTTPSNKDGKTNSGDPEEHWSVTNHDMVSGEQMSLEQLSNLTETMPENLGPKSSTSEIGTLFSPVLESVDFLENEGDGVIYVAELETEETQSYCEIQAFGVSDFCISDITFSGPVSLCNRHIDTAFPSDYECEESSLICDFKQDYMVLPFLEDVLDPESDSAGRHLENSKTFIDAENTNLYMANHLRPNIQVSNVNAYHNLEQDLFDPQMYIKMQPEQPDLTCTLSPTPALNEKLDGKRITLVLDLDETLVHSTLDTGADADFKFTVFFNEKEHVVYVKQRPHLQTFLKRVAEMFEVVVFTASQSIYAKQILDTLDPEGKIISRRAYRDSCIFSEGTYMKDLTIFGVDLARVAIVDNSPQVFRLQVNNGIPIKSWFDDPSDSALISLLPFLESLVDADDVRPLIAEKFGNKE